VGRDPATYVEAMHTADVDDWTKACQYEMDALAKNATWELVDLLPGRKAVKSKWVFKLKSDGCYHACLVAKGFMQIPGIDFDETFSPVARFELLRLLLALAVTYQPLLSPAESRTCIGTLVDDLPDLKPLQDTPTSEDIHYWRHRDDEEDEATVRAILDAEDPQEALKQRLHCGGAYVEEIIND